MIGVMTGQGVMRKRTSQSQTTVKLASVTVPSTSENRDVQTTVRNGRSTMIGVMTGQGVMRKRTSQKLHPKECTSTNTRPKPESEELETFDQPEVSGFFAWAAATTVALIIIILKRLLCQNCKCLRRCMHDYDPQPDQQRPTQQPVQSDNIPLNMLHTPPSTSASNFSTPPFTDASNFSTPPSTDASDFSTPTSVKPLIPEKTSPVGTRTRSKCVKKI
nr:uncharacterized protein LOC111104709 isoform X2 [Crassostrea virginica]XP_022294504.1 uncharacterized protein LOC111104709 isoform X2 [Crassostrea virginica]